MVQPGCRQLRAYHSAADGQSVSGLHAARHGLRLGDFNAIFFVSGGGPAMSTEVLATLGIRYAFTWRSRGLAWLR